MSEHDERDGGPAFPLVTSKQNWNSVHLESVSSIGGMSLRDYFATKAMHAEIVSSWSDATPGAAEALLEAARDAGVDVVDHIALNAYKMADAMLRAREKKADGR